APAVVEVHVLVPTGGGSGFFGQPATQAQSGSGFVVDRRGHIVTNAHVVDGASSVTIAFGDSPDVPARVGGTDNAHDLAVLGYDPSAQGVPAHVEPLTLAASGSAAVGDPVVAIGEPLGLSRTLTAGVVSATGRTIDGLGSARIAGGIQTDAPIN